MANTVAMADNHTRAMDIEESNRLLLKEDVVFKGENDTYEIYADKRIGGGGESQVYLAKRVSDGEQVAAKIYDEYADTKSASINRKKIINFLANLTENFDFKETHIMPLFDFGKVLMESEDGEDFLKPVDIIPYCENGTLKKCDYRQLRDNVIPSVLHAMNLLHDSNLVHRDIKPNNLYELNNEIVLSDFGTTSEILDSKAAEQTGTQRGTPGYTAPEISDRYFVVASDYYSLGCTIATLYKGEHVYQRLLDANDIGKLNIAMRRDRLPLGCADAEADLQALVDSLVMPDEKMRAGYDDVMLWIKDSKSFVSNWKHKRLQNTEAPLLEFKFNDKIYNNETELTTAMLERWDDAKRYLYRGIISEFFKQKNPTLADKTMDIVEKDATHNQELGLAMFLHHFNTTDKSNCPIYWCGKTYGSLSDISNAIAGNDADEHSISMMLKDKFLSWKFNNSKKRPNENTINAIKEIEETAASFPQLGYYAFMYKFAPVDEKNNLTSDEIFKELTNNSGDWYKKAEGLLKNDKTFAYLISLGYKKQVIEMKKNVTGIFISDNGISDLMLLYTLFESVCEDKAYIREHYLNYGPQSYLYWFQEHLNLYSFNSANARGIEEQIKKVKINKKMNISDIFKGFSSLREYLKDFMALLQNNYLLTFIGLRTDKDTTGITTNYTHAFFAGDFFGINVPVGYLKEKKL